MVFSVVITVFYVQNQIYPVNSLCGSGMRQHYWYCGSHHTLLAYTHTIKCLLIQWMQWIVHCMLRRKENLQVQPKLHSKALYQVRQLQLVFLIVIFIVREPQFWVQGRAWNGHQFANNTVKSWCNRIVWVRNHICYNSALLYWNKLKILEWLLHKCKKMKKTDFPCLSMHIL